MRASPCSFDSTFRFPTAVPATGVRSRRIRRSTAARPSARWSRLSLAVLVTAAVVACSGGDDAARRADALAAADTPLEDGAVRQPIPAGIDPAMVTWRSDGGLIPSRDSLQKAPGYVVDSIFPPDEALRRFQAELEGPPVTALTDGAESIDRLLGEYWRLLAAGDTTALTPLVVSKPEYAYLYFPESDEPASGMQPRISWLLLSNNSGRGLTRALAAATADAGEMRGTVCGPKHTVVGASFIHGPCGIVRARASGVDTLLIATHIIERGGIFKLMSFTNEM